MFRSLQQNILTITFLIVGLVPLIAQPTITFSPANGATDVIENTTIILTSDLALRRANDNATLTNGNIASVIVLKRDDNAGVNIPFTATINGAKQVITITPNNYLPSDQLIYVAITNVESSAGDGLSTDPTSITFTTGNIQPPLGVFNPTNSTTGFPVANDLTITFNEPIRNTDDSPITAGDLNTLIELKLTDNSGSAVPFSASINAGNTIITIHPTANLQSKTVYYLEINPVEDFSDNATTASSITFTTEDILPPVATFTPLNGATDVIESVNIVINFDEPIRRALDDATLISANIDALISLKLTDENGDDIIFDATINGAKTQITINPAASLPGNSIIYAAITGIEDDNDNAIGVESITFTTGDTQAPSPVFTPSDGATGVSVSSNLTITFNENIFNATDGSAFDNTSIDNVVIFKLTNAAGADVAFNATFNGTNQITIDPSSNLQGGAVYYVAVSAGSVEDVSGNETGLHEITFTAELPPSITPFSGPTCVGETVTIAGNRFGTTMPTVTINGVAATVEVGTHTNTSITFTIPDTPDGQIIVTNNDNGLSTTSGTTTTIKPALSTDLPLSVSPASPAVNQNYAIVLSNTQSTVNYRVRELPSGFSGGLTAGNGGQLNLGTFNHNNSGSFTYEIQAQSSGCQTKVYPSSGLGFTVTIAQLDVFPGNDRTICSAIPTTLGSTPSATGGTGFYQYSWSAVPADPTLTASTSPNPTVAPTSTTTYTLTVKDSQSSPGISSSVTIQVLPRPTVSFVDTLRTTFIINDPLYLLSDKAVPVPEDGYGDFFGTGIIKNANNNYYFNPQAFTVNTPTIPIKYVHTSANGCKSDTLTENFGVFDSKNLIVNITGKHCTNEALINGVRVNGSQVLPAGMSVSSIKFHNGSGYVSETHPDYPLTVTGSAGIYGPIYRFDPKKAELLGGNSGTYKYFYLDIFLKDASDIEQTSFWSYQSVNIFIPQTEPIILPFKGAPICKESEPITLSSSLDRSGYTYAAPPLGFSINDGSDNSITGTTFDPSEITITAANHMRDLTIRLVYLDPNGCRDTTSTVITVVDKIEAPTAENAEYCTDISPDRRILTTLGIGKSFEWYNDIQLTQLAGEGETFITNATTSRTYSVIQRYQDCPSNAATATITIKPSPNAGFTPPPICLDKTFELQPATPVGGTAYLWDLGDNTTVSGSTVSHTYNTISNYTIKLTATSADNCTNSETRAIAVGINPTADFTYKLTCENDKTEFSASSNIVVQRYGWDFDNGIILPGNRNLTVDAPDEGTYESPKHIFTDGARKYMVTLTAITPIGCEGSITKPVTILNYLEYTTDNFYKMNSIDSGFWAVEDVNGNTSWSFDTPTNSIINNAEPAWVTNANGNYNALDISYVNSPCLNITGIEKPVVSLDYMVNTPYQYDGAVLEYSIDGGVTWKAVSVDGSIQSGYNWFNTEAFYTGLIGKSTIGWSGNVWSDLGGNNRGFITGKHSLDNIAELNNPLTRSKIRFRIAFSSDPATEFEGFAFNNFSITKRNRTILVENFTNELDPEYTSNNQAFKNIPSLETAKIQYHVAFPQSDVQNQINPSDPAARAGYYGVALTNSIVPMGFVDGYSQGNFVSTSWEAHKRDERSLIASPFNITINAQAVDDYLEIETQIDAVESLEGNPILHVAVVQQVAGSNEFVLRKFLPHAAGTRLPTTILATDDPIINSFTYSYSNGGVDGSNLAVVAFIQDELTKEIHQAQVNINPGQIALITGIEDPDFSTKINIYPNPSDKDLHILLPAQTQEKIMLNLFDSFGRAVHYTEFNRGENVKTLTTKNLANGIYILQLETAKGLVRKKVMVVHE